MKIFYITIALLFIFLMIITLSNRNKTDIENPSDLIKSDIVLPTQVVEVVRNSWICEIVEENEYPSNWPSDLPAINDIESVNSTCIENNPNSYKVHIVSTEAYSYITFSITQDLKFFGWKFKSDEPPLNPDTDKTEIILEKDKRKLFVEISKIDTSTEINFVEVY